MAQPTTNHRRTVLKSICAVIAMFGFGFLMVPLYDVLCDVTGLNGKTSNEAVAAAGDHIDKSRTVTVQFLSTTNKQLPWEFKPNVVSVKVHPGENKRISYFAKNLSPNAMTVQAIPSVSPGIAAKYLKKTECFCFEQQRLAAGDSMDMPLLFHLDTDLPPEIGTVTLSYTLFDASQFKQKVNTGRITN